MQNIRFICAQPANSYYTWQVEVVINNFIKHGVNPNQIDILCCINDDIVPEDWRKLQNHYNSVRFFFYNDTRSDFKYIPAIYFNLMSNHLKAHPELKDEVLFLHDSDIVFTRRPELDWVTNKKIWYMSDTNSYINYDYIQQKENYIYEKMCEIVGIDKRIPKLMNSHSGGAQYIVNGEGWEFWDKVEKDAITMYDYFCEVEPLYVKKYEGDYPIQKWTAGMWSLLWNAWLSGHETKVDDRISFGWSTDPIDRVEKHWILHNAGVTADSKGLFFKGAYIHKLPYNEVLEADETRASSYYWKQVQETGLKSILVTRHKRFSEVIELSKGFGLGFDLEYSIDDSLKLSNHYHPWSMREHEARIVYDLIVENGLKSGFEIATAFGISASVMGQALKKTGGKLVTMDAYVEENFNYSGGYDINTKLVQNIDADGYKMAKKLIEVLDISNNVSLEIGWSPDDTGGIIERNFGSDKLDFAFIDGGHTQAQIDADVKAVYPYLADDAILLFHDHVDVSEETKQFIRDNGFVNEKNYHTGFNLYAYSKGNKKLI
jgi:predicted O-methyltransferase YrrM